MPDKIHPVYGSHHLRVALWTRNAINQSPGFPSNIKVSYDKNEDANARIGTCGDPFDVIFRQ